ncbi:MAG: acyltransferase [Bacteroidales bacterium]|nr:acyltransferase [Bacteroidales bacterium]
MEQRIFTINNNDSFINLALDTFFYQYENNEVYNLWCRHLNINIDNVTNIEDIPFLPIEFFKTHNVVTGKWKDEAFFQSSGTTNAGHSIHHIKSLSLYIKSFVNNFEFFFGDIKQYCFLAVLPSYVSNPHSSLIFMIDYLVKITSDNGSKFYNEDFNTLLETIACNEEKGQKTILFGVTYALLDIIKYCNSKEIIPKRLNNTFIFETGGMKGKRKEMPKEELHSVLCEGFGVKTICSEYGMCELLSQAYSLENGIFKVPPQMRIVLRDINDPLSFTTGRGVINVIDLANIYSCSFIATSDLGEIKDVQTFKILGRLDNSDIRGCNLLYF